MLSAALLSALVCSCASGAAGEGSPLRLATAASAGRGCPAAGLVAVRVGRAGDELVFLSVATGERVSVVWPHGFTAREVDGVAVLVGRDGAVIAREDDVLDNLGGGPDISDSAFYVCSRGSTLY